jgi:hypothetical protein
MKKLLILLPVLIIITAVVFYFGWIQLKVDKDHYGVVFTKISGYREYPVVPGKFAWSAGALLPKNLQIISVPASARTVRIDASGGLPSHADYSSVTAGGADFT